ncbi:hypothetical protein LTR37_011693 [Vermiconidia calcicola]|uniref:Uncharacterized protein n=1 Tax=Vermiconidia calcicola TaxID=1690605 RepID=A0ACC3N164_9PEZI|nr:hypothetical protein LTR37_011693 [Vermiconidia calcicola]
MTEATNNATAPPTQEENKNNRSVIMPSDDETTSSIFLTPSGKTSNNSNTPTTGNNNTPSTTSMANTNTPTTTPNSNPAHIVLQHSKSASHSPLLPFSNIVGVFAKRDEALTCLHSLKDQRLPFNEARAWRQPGGVPQYWNTSDGQDGDECGYQYISRTGEEFVVWMEEHEITG